MSDFYPDTIPQECLLDLLTAVAARAQPTGIAALDDHPDARVLHIQGPPASGKTQFIYFLLATCIMPLSLGGWGKIAIVFDTDATFDILQFKTLLSHRLSNPPLISTCLDHLCILRPASSLHLATSLANIPKYISAHFPDHELGIVAIDSLSTFYWPDRFLAERVPGSDQVAPPNPLRHVLGALQSLRLSLAPFIVLSNWGLVPADLTTQPAHFRQHLNPFPAGSNNPSAFSIDLHLTTGESTEGSGTYIGRVQSVDSERRISYTVNTNGIEF